MTYTRTFIQIADDCPASEGIVPVSSRKQTPIHIIQYELLSKYPYQYDHKELIFAVYVARNDIPAEEVAERRQELWHELFQKEHPCLRASSLTKRYGWGAHYNEAGKIALYGAETAEYQQFLEQAESNDQFRLLKAMRNKRAKS